MVAIQHSTLKFLKQLSANNNREWFTRNKHLYDQAQANMIQFAEDLFGRLSKHDSISTPSGRRALFRIYSDTRFHKNRPPYNERFAMHFGRTKPFLRGGYYLHISPGNSYVSCGFFGPNADDLKRIREDIVYNLDDWKKICNNKKFKSHFGAMQGAAVKTAPQGFSKDQPGIELIRHKELYFHHDFTDKEVLSKDFSKQVNQSFKNIRPWFDYMSEVLTTDANGQSLFADHR